MIWLGKLIWNLDLDTHSDFVAQSVSAVRPSAISYLNLYVEYSIPVLENHFWCSDIIPEQLTLYVLISHQIFEQKSLFGVTNGIFGLPDFQTDEGNSVRVNSKRYWTMLTDFLWLQFEEMDLDDRFFQQYSSTCHTSGWNVFSNTDFSWCKSFYKVIYS